MRKRVVRSLREETEKATGNGNVEISKSPTTSGYQEHRLHCGPGTVECHGFEGLKQPVAVATFLQKSTYI